MSAGHDISGNKVTPLELPDEVQTLEDIQNDPDYTALGWGESGVGIDYEKIIAYLIACIQEQQTIIETEKQKLSIVEQRITTLESKLVALES